MDERIEAFLNDVLRLEGADANTVREGVRAFLAVYEDMVRDGEPERHKGTRRLSRGASYAASEWPRK
jgi:hypothetical protein